MRDHIFFIFFVNRTNRPKSSGQLNLPETLWGLGIFQELPEGLRDGMERTAFMKDFVEITGHG